MTTDSRGEDRDPGGVTIRAATPADVGTVHRMIGALAEFEQLTHLCVAGEADLDAALFGPHPAAEVLLAELDGNAAGFALFFHNYSTFLGRRGLWLEDLFVLPEYRRRGCAGALLTALARIANERNCGRFEWAVLDWNAGAIDFYRKLGATVLPDWRIVRVVGPALAALAGSPPIAASVQAASVQAASVQAASVQAASVHAAAISASDPNASPLDTQAT